MKTLIIDYNHEFISNKIKDELIINDIWNFKELEKDIIQDIKDIFLFDISPNKNINTLSGGQRSIAYMVTLKYILKEKDIYSIKLKMNNIIESLSVENGKKLIKYINKGGIVVN